jgi:hypothetical protein
MIPALSDKATAKDAWDAIATVRIGSDHVRKSTLQKLRQEWDNLAFKPGEDVDDFALRLTGLRQRLEQLGDYDITEERAVAKFLRCSPTKYLQLKISIQTMLDISTLTIEEVAGRFNVVDEEEELAAAETVATGGKLHYATEHCHCHICQKKGESSPSSGDCKRTPRRAPKAHGGAEGEARGGAGGAARRCRRRTWRR